MEGESREGRRRFGGWTNKDRIGLLVVEIVGMGRAGSEVFAGRVAGEGFKLLYHVRLVEVTTFACQGSERGFRTVSENMQSPLEPDNP